MPSVLGHEIVILFSEFHKTGLQVVCAVSSV